jgi:HEAT repeat protein
VKHESLLACAQLIQTVRSKQTPPKVREAAIHGLGAYDLPLAHGLLRDVLAGGLDHLGEVRRARSAAFTALGLMTSEAAADLLIEAGLRRQRGAIQNGSDSWRVAARRALGHACLQSDDLSRSLAAKYLVVPNQAGKLTAHRVEVALLVTEAFGQAGPGLAREAVAAVAESLAHLSAVPSAAVSESGLAAALAKTLGQAGAVRHGRLLVNLVDSDLSSRHWTVREAAVEALGVMGSADLGSEHGQAEGQGGGGTTDALGQDSYVACLAVAMRRDPDQRVREMAALALARIPVAGSVEALVASLPSQSPMGAEQQALYGCQSTALFLLTGRVPGHPRGWVDLVDQFGATGLLEPLLSSGPPSQAEWEGAETLFGLPAQSSSVLFLVDISDSMRHEGKIALAKRQLVRMIETLGSQTRFSVWAFSDGVQRLLPTPRPATRLLQDRMISRVDLLRARQGARTGLEKVLQLALEPGHVDVVVLLTDGLLESQSSIGSAALIDRVGKYNTKRRSILHVVGVFRGEAALHLDRGGDRGDPASDLLRGLARENKGLLLRN